MDLMRWLLAETDQPLARSLDYSPVLWCNGRASSESRFQRKTDVSPEKAERRNGG